MTFTPLRLALAASLLGACEPQSVEAVTSPVCVSSATPNCAAEGGASNAGASSGGATNGGTNSGGSGAISGGASRPAPVHRYSFNGVGTRVVDSMGGPDGAVVGATLNGMGEVVLGGDDQYVDLPNHLLANLQSATFESWLSWDGGSPWQRVFDFGEDETGQDGSRAGSPRDYFFFTVLNFPNQGSVMRVTYMKPGGNEIILDAPSAFPISKVEHHVAVVLDADNQALRLYLDGEHQDSVAPFTASLADIYDINNWLGRSQYSGDPSLSGRYLEFRIYAVALTPNQIEQSFAAGPDASFQ